MSARSVDLLTSNILGNPDLVAQLKQDPVTVLHQQAAVAKAGTPLDTDPIIYRIVVSCLGAAMILTAFGLIALTWNNSTIPEGLVALGSAAVGALAGLLAPSPRTG